MSRYGFGLNFTEIGGQQPLTAEGPMIVPGESFLNVGHLRAIFVNEGSLYSSGLSSSNQFTGGAYYFLSNPFCGFEVANHPYLAFTSKFYDTGVGETAFAFVAKIEDPTQPAKSSINLWSRLEYTESSTGDDPTNVVFENVGGMYTYGNSTNNNLLIAPSENSEAFNWYSCQVTDAFAGNSGSSIEVTKVDQTELSTLVGLEKSFAIYTSQWIPTDSTTPVTIAIMIYAGNHGEPYIAVGDVSSTGQITSILSAQIPDAKHMSTDTVPSIAYNDLNNTLIIGYNDQEDGISIVSTTLTTASWVPSDLNWTTFETNYVTQSSPVIYHTRHPSESDWIFNLGMVVTANNTNYLMGTEGFD